MNDFKYKLDKIYLNLEYNQNYLKIVKKTNSSEDKSNTKNDLIPLEFKLDK